MDIGPSMAHGPVAGSSVDADTDSDKRRRRANPPKLKTSCIATIVDPLENFRIILSVLLANFEVENSHKLEGNLSIGGFEHSCEVHCR